MELVSSVTATCPLLRLSDETLQLCSRNDDAFDALMTEQWCHLSLDEVRDRSQETHRRLVAYVESVPPERFLGDTRARRRLRLDTYGHYPIHTADIRRWREHRLAG